jgi:hypothetical protein
MRARRLILLPLLIAGLLGGASSARAANVTTGGLGGAKTPSEAPHYEDFEIAWGRATGRCPCEYNKFHSDKAGMETKTLNAPTPDENVVSGTANGFGAVKTGGDTPAAPPPAGK